MKLSIKNKVNPSFSMASMTDIIFLLLIFLLISTHYHSKAIPVDLPLSTNEKTISNPINVTMTAQLEYYVEENKIPFHQLHNVLQAKLIESEHKAIVLHIDKGLSIANMVQIADIAIQLGASFSIATEFSNAP